MLRFLALLVLLGSGCSILAVHVPDAQVPLAAPLDCPSSTAPTIDTTVAITGLVVGTAGLISLPGNYYSGLALLAIVPMIVVGGGYALSARHGFREQRRCTALHRATVAALASEVERLAIGHSCARAETTRESLRRFDNAAAAQVLPAVLRCPSTKQRLDAELQETEALVRALPPEMSELADAHAAIASTYQRAFAAVSSIRITGLPEETAEPERRELQRAVTMFEQAASSWRVFRRITQAAAALSPSVLCGPVSRQTFGRSQRDPARRVVYLVPPHVGGVDHPGNYKQVSPPIDDTPWTAAACVNADDGRCLTAIAITARCGSYRGGY